MTRKSSCHLLDMLAKVEDPRKDKGKRHPLKSILALIVIGLMCGHRGWTSIATWTQKNALCCNASQSPEKLDVVALEKTLTEWVNTIIKGRPDLSGCLDAVAIDGPTMRASQKSGATTSHGLSVVSHELGITITQQSVSDKTNEGPISTEILKAFDVSGKVITTDALLTQKTFCQAVIVLSQVLIDGLERVGNRSSLGP